MFTTIRVIRAIVPRSVQPANARMTRGAGAPGVRADVFVPAVSTGAAPFVCGASLPRRGLGMQCTTHNDADAPTLGASGAAASVGQRQLPDAPAMTEDITASLAAVQSWIKSFPASERALRERAETSFESLRKNVGKLSKERARYVLTQWIIFVRNGDLRPIARVMQVMFALEKIRIPGATFADFRQRVAKYRALLDEISRDHPDAVNDNAAAFARFSAKVVALEIEEHALTTSLADYVGRLRTVEKLHAQLPTGGKRMNPNAGRTLGATGTHKVGGRRPGGQSAYLWKKKS